MDVIAVRQIDILCMPYKLLRLLKLLCVISVVLCSTELSAVPVFQSAKIMPLNRLTMLFSKELPKYTAILSNDKKNITINFGIAEIKDTATKISSDGIIKNISFFQLKDTLFAKIELSEARGYTLSALPFSQSIMLEVFDWNKLSDVEENYRMGLLSMEEELYDLAKPDLFNAVTADVADAGFFLGLILMKEGKINSALKNFQFAEAKSTEISDNNAAMYQIFDMKNDKKNAEYYEKLYLKQSNNSPISKIVIANIIEKGDSCVEDVRHANSVINQSDSLKTKHLENEKAKDTSNQFSNIFNKDSLKNQDAENENNLILKYAAGIVLAMVLLVIYLYLKWRNRQILNLKNAEKPQINTTKESSKSREATTLKSKKNANAATTGKKQILQKQPKQDFGKIIDKTLADEKLPMPNYKKDKPLKNIADNDTGEQKKSKMQYPQSEIERSQKAEELLKIIHNLPQNASESEKEIYGNKNRSATIELAEHLAIEQKKIKNKNIQEIPATLGLDNKKLEAVAKKLGIETGGLETKQAVEKFEQNTSEVSKLSEKFKEKK